MSEEARPSNSSTGGMVAIVIVAIIVVLLLVFGSVAGYKSFMRYQKRADASNNVKISAIEIRNQAQRVLIAKQKAEIRKQDAVGVREAQDEIAKTLTPLYVAWEMTQALEHIATSGTNNSLIYIPTSPSTGLPVVPTSSTAGK
jgi:uncharacterized membrane protein